MNRVVYVPQSQLVKINHADLSIKELKKTIKHYVKAIAMAENGELDDVFSKCLGENPKKLFIDGCHRNMKEIDAEIRKRELN